MVVALVTLWRAAGGIPCDFRIRNVTEGIERSGTRLQNLGDVGSCAEVTGQRDSKYSFIHSGHFYSAPSSPLLLGGAPDYSTDTVSEFHAEAHEVSCQFVSASCFVGLTGTYRHEKSPGMLNRKSIETCPFWFALPNIQCPVIMISVCTIVKTIGI